MKIGKTVTIEAYYLYDGFIHLILNDGKERHYKVNVGNGHEDEAIDYISSLPQAVSSINEIKNKWDLTAMNESKETDKKKSKEYSFDDFLNTTFEIYYGGKKVGTCKGSDFKAASEDDFDEIIEESLTEDLSPEDAGVSSVFSDLIQKEYDLIGQYDSAQITLEDNGDHRFSEIFEYIKDDINIHIGMLQSCMEDLNGSEEQTAIGEQKADELIGESLKEGAAEGYAEIERRFGKQALDDFKAWKKAADKSKRDRKYQWIIKSRKKDPRAENQPEEEKDIVVYPPLETYEGQTDWMSKSEVEKWAKEKYGYGKACSNFGSRGIHKIYINDPYNESLEEVYTSKKVVYEVPSEDIQDISLLSLEALRFQCYVPKSILKMGSWWWLSNAATSIRYGRAAFVDDDGKVSWYGREVEDVGSVRPVLKVKQLPKGLISADHPNPVVSCLGKKWICISTSSNNNLLLSMDSIGQSCFNANKDEKSSNEYEGSDIQNYLQDWLQQQMNKNESLTLDESLFESRRDPEKEIILDAIDTFIELGGYDIDPNKFGTDSWEELRDQIEMGIDYFAPEMAQCIKDYLEKDIQFDKKHPEMFEEDPEAGIRQDIYDDMNRILARYE